MCIASFLVVGFVVVSITSWADVCDCLIIGEKRPENRHSKMPKWGNGGERTRYTKCYVKWFIFCNFANGFYSSSVIPKSKPQFIYMLKHLRSQLCILCCLLQKFWFFRLFIWFWCVCTPNFTHDILSTKINTIEQKSE